MKNLLCAVTVQFLVLSVFAYLPYGERIETDLNDSLTYREYHHLISSAEELYFLQNNVDSSLACYQRCFESFEFVFARDAINAFQIAYRENRPLDYFLKTAIESGVTPSIIESISALTSFAQDSLLQLSPMRDYDLYRSRYLARINVDCLNSVYTLGSIDQINKYQKGKHETGSLFKLAFKFGLPGEKNCGIEQLGIEEELGSEAADFISLRDSVANAKGRDLRYYSLDNNSLIMHIPLVIMLHNACTYKEYEQSLQNAYLEGFIHPREVGCIYDNSYMGDSNCKMFPIRGVFALNALLKSGNFDTQKANQLRAQWGICSVETDRKKKELETLGFKFLWDYW